MTKNEVYQYLQQQHIDFEITEHPAVFEMDMEEIAKLPYPQCASKTLFLCDDKHRSYYLVTVKGPKHVDLKELRKQLDSRRLTFASAEELQAILQLQHGLVGPLGLLQAQAPIAGLYLDAEFAQAPGLVGVHPNDNTATLWLQATDLLRLAADLGYKAEMVQLSL